jgi:hypothetical protein
MGRKVALLATVALCTAGIGWVSAPSAVADTQDFTTVGAHPFQVPANVCQVHVTALGAQGGTGRGTLLFQGPGQGGSAAATVAVTPGETLSVFVGERGGDAFQNPANVWHAGAGGQGGGGKGGDTGVGNTFPGGGGGGESSVSRGSTALVIAGGGGGSPGNGASGGAGGGSGTNGDDGTGGLGGKSGGNGGAGGPGGPQFSTGQNGGNGSAGQGGNGGDASNRDGGGGGGGGATGGGGGGGTGSPQSGGGGGGGGSGLVPSGGTMLDGQRAGDGRVTISFEPTVDGCDQDGVPPNIEDGVGPGGDGNGDGIPDSAQPDVASLPAAVGGGYVTVDDLDGAPLTNVTVTDPATLPPAPGGATLPAGVVSFTIDNLAPGATVTVDVYFHGLSSLPPRYFKFQNGAWLDFTAHTTFSGDVARLTLTDGGAGDSTGVDGKIVDPGGPGRASGRDGDDHEHDHDHHPGTTATTAPVAQAVATNPTFTG